jgi:superfamily II DNA or RNA helicase
MDRDTRQLEIANKFIKLNKSGTLIANTGFGKSRTGLLIHKLIGSKNTIVVVPTIELQTQWLKQVDKYCRVIVVNTLANSLEECNLLIMDEWHRYPGEYFKLSYENTKYKRLLGLTATIERQDGLHSELLKVAPIFENVTFEECILNNWTNEYLIYNIGLDFTDKELHLYHNIERSLKSLEEFLGVGADAFNKAKVCLKSKDFKNVSAGKKYFDLIKKRKELIYNAKNKLIVTKKIIENYNTRKVLVFSQTTEFADNLQNLLGDICLTVHSKLNKKQRDFAIKRFKDNRTKIRAISSVKSLIEGLDVPDCNIGIMTSGTSSKISQSQSLGRILRKNNRDEIALFFNLYIKNSQDLYWLKNRLYGLPPERIKWSNYEIQKESIN